MKKQDGKPEGKQENEQGIMKRAQTQKEMIIRKLKERGSRMTRQRLMLLDIILENEYACCKEIYYRAAGRDEKISPATVYRMVNTLEEIGAISRNNMYRIVGGGTDGERAYEAEFDDGTILRLSAEEWYQVIRAGLDRCGYLKKRELCGIRVKPAGDWGGMG